MSDKSDQGDEGISEQRREHQRAYTIHVGVVTLEYDEPLVLASQILADAGFTPPDQYVLELLHGKAGAAKHEYKATDIVDLKEAKGHYFRSVPSGGGRA